MSSDPRWKAPQQLPKPRKRLPHSSRRKQRGDREYATNRALVLAAAGDQCAICGERASVTHHVLPRSRGGSHDVSNLLALDQKCHERVHANPVWARERGYLK